MGSYPATMPISAWTWPETALGWAQQTPSSGNAWTATGHRWERIHKPDGGLIPETAYDDLLASPLPERRRQWRANRFKFAWFELGQTAAFRMRGPTEVGWDGEGIGGPPWQD